MEEELEQQNSLSPRSSDEYDTNQIH